MHIKREDETEKERERSVFSTVLLALVAVLAVEIAMLLLSFTLSGFTSRLNSNAEQILDKQVVNRAAYISGQLIEAQDLSGLDSAVNRAAAQLVQEGETVASLTSSNEGSAPLFDAVSDQMVRILREKNVTGVYIVLHTGELSRTAGGSLPCLYLRDLDPSAPASVTNDDLLLEHAPTAVMHRMSISTSENWEPGILAEDTAPDGWTLAYDMSVPSCRLLNQPYDASDTENTQHYVIDGLILSPNVQLKTVETVDAGFENSDHNPVLVTVVLEK